MGPVSNESVTRQGQYGRVTGDDHPLEDDDELNDQEETGGGEGPEAREPSEIRLPIDPAIFESLIPFRDLQRTIAAMDFTGIRAAQQAAEAFATQIPDLAALQNTIQTYIARSVDFSAIAAIQRNFANLPLPQILEQAKWAEGIAESLNLPALQQANDLLAATNFPGLTDTTSALAVALAAHSQDWLKTFQTIDIARLLEGLDRWLPENLRELDDLDAVARIALDEGIPLSWIPRASIVQQLVAAANYEERLELLDAHRVDILADCDAALANVHHQWAQECRDATRALRVGLDGPAQSHAAGIIDSIVLCVLGPKNGRQLAKQRAVEEWDDIALRVAGENLALRPLYRALVTWFPGSGTPPPDYFARHPTAHAVGQPGLFQRRHALIAVMLAVSLTMQFSDDPASAAGLLSAETDYGTSGDVEPDSDASADES